MSQSSLRTRAACPSTRMPACRHGSWQLPLRGRLRRATCAHSAPAAIRQRISQPLESVPLPMTHRLMGPGAGHIHAFLKERRSLLPIRSAARLGCGIDEISIRKGHSYRMVVSDLLRERPIWFGGSDRSEASMDECCRFLGDKKAERIRLAVMDMWKAFRNSAARHAPKAAILFDKFHIMRHFGDALDEVRKSEYRRLHGQDRCYIKGQKYTLLSNKANLTLEGKRALKKLLAANKRLNTAYLLKESFEQLWSYTSETWARKFFDNWCASLKWQRLEPYEKFARMIDRHWDGIAAYCKPENKVPLGFVEGLNNKIRVIQRRAYGLRDEEYLRLKVLTCMLPPI